MRPTRKQKQHKYKVKNKTRRLKNRNKKGGLFGWSDKEKLIKLNKIHDSLIQECNNCGGCDGVEYKLPSLTANDGIKITQLQNIINELTTILNHKRKMNQCVY